MGGMSRSGRRIFWGSRHRRIYMRGVYNRSRAGRLVGMLEGRYWD